MIRSSRIVALIATVAFASIGVSTAGEQKTTGTPILRDVWFGCEVDGNDFGFEHVTVEKLDDGTYSYRVESRYLLDLLGQQQEITRKATYIVTQGFEPVSLLSEGKQQSGDAKVTGRVDCDEFLLVYEREGLRRERRVNLSKKPLFLPCLDDWLAGQLKSTTTLHPQIIDDSSFEIEEADVTLKTIGDYSTVWNVKPGADFGQGIVMLDIKGIRLDSQFRAPPLHLHRITSDQAGNIKRRVYQGREILMFPVDKPIGPLQQLTSLTIRLRWEGAGIEQLRLEDERQKVIETSEQNGKKNILLKVQSVDDNDEAAIWPPKSDTLQQYLAEDRLIQPNDPNIQKQAREWVGEEKSAMGTVRALSRGVFKYMQGGTLIVETLPASEILQCKQGKCSEYSILFASAARSIGIPTRIALGMRITHNSWVGHMWNEVYVGRWVTVDNTTDEVGNVPALLKLVDSDTAMGTQPARWAAVDSLNFTIEDSTPTPSNEKNKTGIEGSVYTNGEFACRMTAPHSNWLLENTPQKGIPVTVVRFKVPDRDDVLIHFVPIDVPAIFTPRALIEIRAAKFKLMYKDFEIVKNEDFAIQQMDGRLFAFQRSEDQPELKKMKTTEVLWSDGTSCFLLNLIANEKAHDEFAADFFKLLNSFESLREPRQPKTKKQ